MATPRLYTYWRSSASYRVRIVLGFKKVAFESVTVNIVEGDQNKEGYAKLNPSGYVPALTLGDRTFVESVAITEFLDELYPEPPLFPKSPEERADVRAMVQVINAGIQPLQNLNVLQRLSADTDVRKGWVQHYNEKGLRALESLLERYEARHGTKGPFACGAAPTMADVFIVPQVYGARRYDVDVSKFPRVSRAATAAGDIEAWKSAHPDAQPDAVGPKPGASPR